METKTQVDQPSPMMDSINKEAEEVVLAHLEERLAADLFIFCLRALHFVSVLSPPRKQEQVLGWVL